MDDILSRLKNGAIGQVAVGVHKRGSGKMRREDEFLAADFLIDIIAYPQGE